MQLSFWKLLGATAAFIFVLSTAPSAVLAQVNQPNPNVGNPFNPPPNAVAWAVVNIDVESPNLPHSDGPFSLPGKPNPNGYPVLDPATLSWSGTDLCPYIHKHGTFPPLSGAHGDPAPGPPKPPGTLSACGHGGIIYLDTNGEVIPPPLALLIGDIQGLRHVSPRVGQSVAITGTVTLRTLDGVYVQGASDGDDDTSDALFISTPLTDTLNLGDKVTVSGIVNEFRPGEPDSANLTRTQVISAFITTNSSGNPLPTPVVIGTGGRVPPKQVINTDDGSGDVESPSALYLPNTDGLDFYESLEGMLAQIRNNIIVGPTDDRGAIWVVGDDGANAGPFTARGGLLAKSNDFNPERLKFNRILAFARPSPPRPA
jgi:hypothetical protein